MKKIKAQNRIWELDATRGLFVLGMVIMHVFFDLDTFAGIKLFRGGLLEFVRDYGFAGFLLISGISATFSRNSVKRGLAVFLVAMLFTAATYTLMQLGIIDRGLLITFGILHLIGVSMLTYPLYKGLPVYAVALIGAAIIALGIHFLKIYVDSPYLFALGLRTKSYAAGDYFPVFPYMGVFILGTAAGRLLYPDRKSLMPKTERYFTFLSYIGRNALIIYILHQPLIYLVVMLGARLLK